MNSLYTILSTCTKNNVFFRGIDLLYKKNPGLDKQIILKRLNNGLKKSKITTFTIEQKIMKINEKNHEEHISLEDMMVDL